MSIESEVNRLLTAKMSIKEALMQKGVEVPEGTKIDGMANYINQIQDPIDEGKLTKTAYMDVTITNGNEVWNQTEDGTFIWESTYEQYNEASICNVYFDKNSLPTAVEAGILPVTSFEGGTLKLYATSVPTADMTATLEFAKGGW